MYYEDLLKFNRSKPRFCGAFLLEFFMTVPVPDQLVYISDADGVTKTFPYPKRFLQKDEIVVLLRDADGVDKVQRLNIDYTIAGSAWQNGGDVVFYAAPSSGLKVVRYRMTQAKQTVDLANNQRNDAKAVELQLDRTIMAVQDQGTKINSINIGMMETLEKGKEAQKAAEDARDIAVDAASDAVSQGNVPIYSTLTAIASLEIPVGITAIRVNGRNAVGDGLGGLYIDTDNGSSDMAISADGRIWYRVTDVHQDRLSKTISDKLNGYQKASPLIAREKIGQAGLRVPLKNPPHLSGRVIQGFTFDSRSGEFYSVSGEGTDFVDRRNTIVRHDKNGNVLDFTDALQLLGHAQGLSSLIFNEKLTFISQNDNGDGVTSFEYVAGSPSTLVNIRQYGLTSSGNKKHTTIGLSADKRIVSAYYRSEIDDKFYIRLFDIQSLLSGAVGDRSNEYLNEICLSDIPEFDGRAETNQHGQGCTSDENFVYSLNGYWQIDSPKYLYIIRISDGTLYDKIEITVGKSFAASMGTGVTYEPEDLEWIAPRNGGLPVLYMGMRTGGAPNNNWSLPLIDSLGTLSVNGDNSPLGIGMLFSGGPHDIVYRGFLKFGTVSTVDNSYKIEDNSGVSAAGRWWSKERFVASSDEFADISNSSTAIGASLNYWGGISATRDSGNAMVLNRLGTDGAVSYFYKSGVLVGSIAVTGSGTSYNQTSDASLKRSNGELSLDDAKKIVELITIHNFTWLGEYSSGGEDVGVFAQELYEIYPRAVTVGGWFFEDGAEANEGDEGAVYHPWGVDYMKLIPLMIVCLQSLIKKSQNL